LACMLIANMRKLGSLTRHQAAVLIGVASLNDDSGAQTRLSRLDGASSRMLKNGRIQL
jgi:hypothetical protein